MSYILMEAASGYVKKYKCPYCEKRLDRNKLVTHIDRKHYDLLPKGYTPTHMVFDVVNKKDHGTCIICGKESPWNENKARYDRLCGDLKCKKTYQDITNKRIKKIHGMTGQDMLKDTEFQKKMLENRKISGKYKFKDGTVHTYTGSYEKKFLEFMDIYFEVDGIDIETPGPCIEYTYKGQKHKWITDAYYAPYNLVFDIKDGGDNPNNREMSDYRAKQTAKENAITKLGKYNYIRLTNNDFSQLIEIMLELKLQLVDTVEEFKPIIRINETGIITEGYEYVDEEAIYTTKEKYPVYIIAMHSGTLLANTIKSITKDEFSHACISFNSSLDPMYSFGSKKLGDTDLGFVIQNPNDDFYKKYKAHYKVFVTFVDKKSYNKMKERIKWFEDNNEKFNYDLIGLIKILFHKDTEDHTYSYFCSRLVAEILGLGKTLNKVPSLYKPTELANLYFTSIVNGGDDFSKYNKKNTDRNLKNIKNGIYDDISFSEANIDFDIE